MIILEKLSLLIVKSSNFCHVTHQELHPIIRSFHNVVKCITLCWEMVTGLDSCSPSCFKHQKGKLKWEKKSAVLLHISHVGGRRPCPAMAGIFQVQESFLRRIFLWKEPSQEHWFLFCSVSQRVDLFWSHSGGWWSPGENSCFSLQAIFTAGVNISPTKIWNCPSWNLGYFETVWPDQPENLWNCLSKFSNSLKSMRFDSFMNRNQKKLLYQIFVSL